MPKAEPIDEYKILNENMRWFSNVRFAQLTLFIAISAGLLTLAFTPTYSLSRNASIAVKTFGILTAIVFWWLEELAADYWRHFRHRAQELEKGLGYKQYSTYKHRRVNSSHLFRVFFISLLVVWVITLIWP